MRFNYTSPRSWEKKIGLYFYKPSFDWHLRASKEKIIQRDRFVSRDFQDRSNNLPSFMKQQNFLEVKMEKTKKYDDIKIKKTKEEKVFEFGP